MKTLTVFLVCLASVAWGEDIATISGKVYKHASVTRVEPDGLVIKFAGGIVKIPFTELSKELQQRYDYDPEAAEKFRARTPSPSMLPMRAWNAKGATSKIRTGAGTAPPANQD